MSNREIEAILKISSKLGSMHALRTLTNELRKVDNQAKAYNRSQMSAMRATNAALMASARFFAPAALGYGATRAFTEFAAVERRMNRIGITADASAEATKKALTDLNKFAVDYAMPIDQAMSGLEALVASGRSLEDAMAFLPSTLATAQAAGAEVADIATTSDAVGNSFGISGDKMQRAFDILVAGGKAGKFELKDMAQYLPSLAPAWAALGYEGEGALRKIVAAAQVVRDRTGSAGEAATALQNVIQKMSSNETQNRFKALGVDLRKELDAARKSGKDVLDTFLDLTTKVTKGDLSKLPQIFSDAQLQTGVRALLAGRENMDALAKSLKNVDGSTLKDLGKVLSDTQSTIDKMSTSWDRFKTKLGETIAPPVTAALDAILDGTDRKQAEDAALDRRGVKGFWAKEMWRLGNGSRAALDGLAVDGGYNMGKQVLPDLKYNSGMPLFTPSVPVPMRRPARPGEAGYVVPRPTASGPSAPEAGFDLPPSRSERIEADAKRNADELGFAIESATDAGGEKMKAGIETGAESGASAIGDAISRAGDIVAAKIAAAVSNIRVGVSGVPGGRPSADVGKQGGDIPAIP